jgi:cob(I)alamin adenosyltransferase
MIIDYSTISTKKGDSGSSLNYSGETLPKTDLLFETLGTLDELSSLLGLSYHYATSKDILRAIQLDLQDIMTLVAINPHKQKQIKLQSFSSKSISRIEQLEQTFLEQAPLEPKFVLPGSSSSLEGAHLDLSRAVTRKAERILLSFVMQKQRTDLKDACIYLNRLSDLLYIMARSTDTQQQK